MFDILLVGIFARIFPGTKTNPTTATDTRKSPFANLSANIAEMNKRSGEGMPNGEAPAFFHVNGIPVPTFALLTRPITWFGKEKDSRQSAA